MKIDKADFRKCLAAFFSIISLGYMTAITFCTIPKENVNNANIILGFLIGTALGTIISFYFGAAESSNEE
jgi:putative flippase GtrA